MKENMNKIVNEPARYGGDKEIRKKERAKIKQWIHEEKFEDIPLRASIKPKVDWDDIKEKSFNMNPLIRFLYKNIGKNWDSIYSEIKKSLDFKTLDSLGNLEWLINKEVIYFNNKPMVPGYDHKYIPLIDWGRTRFYVCPKTNCLKKVDKRKFKPKEKEETRIFLKKTDEHESFISKEDGIWYYCEYGYIDGILGITKKEQLSKKQLKQSGLTNDKEN